MAPETRMKGYGSKADIFSIGAVLFEMATGDVHINAMTLAEFNGIIRTANLSDSGNQFLQLCLVKYFFSL